MTDLASEIARRVATELRAGVTPVGYVDTRGAATYLGVSAQMLEKLRVAGGGPDYIKLAKAVRYKLSDLDAWMNTRRCRSTSETRTTTNGHART